MYQSIRAMMHFRFSLSYYYLIWNPSLSALVSFASAHQSPFASSYWPGEILLLNDSTKVDSVVSRHRYAIIARHGITNHRNRVSASQTHPLVAILCLLRSDAYTNWLNTPAISKARVACLTHQAFPHLHAHRNKRAWWALSTLRSWRPPADRPCAFGWSNRYRIKHRW